VTTFSSAAYALVGLGQLVLDAGRVDAVENEFNLEHITENVGRFGAEAHFRLPGSIEWSFDLRE
jgi:hypothetical protein